MSKKTNNLLWWTVGAAALYAFTRSAANVGKLYDSEYIRPNGRVDRYWDGETAVIHPSRYGVESYDLKQYYEPKAAIKHFNLYSIEFGNWMSQEDRANFMYATLVSLRDIATVAGVPQRAVGMGGHLAIALGARGNGGNVAAFYVPQPYHLINLTKTNGRGSFCHEFAHAVDWHFKVGTGGISMRKQPDYTGLRQNSVAYYFEKVLEAILWNEDGTPSTYHTWLDKKSDYYNRRTEIWARTCEHWFFLQFKKKGIKNTWAVENNVESDWPNAKLIERANKWITKIYGSL